MPKDHTLSRLPLMLQRFLILASLAGAQLAVAAPGDLRLMAPRAHTASVEAMAVSPDAQLVATGGADQRVNLWHPASGRQWRSLAGHGAVVGALAFSADGKLLVSGDGHGDIRLWRVGEGVTACAWPEADPLARDAIVRVGFGAQKEVWSLNNRGILKRWNADGCKSVAPQTLHDGAVRDVLRHPGGWWLLTPQELTALDAGGKPRWTFPLPTQGVRLLDLPAATGGAKPGGAAVLLDDGTSLAIDAQGKPGARTDFAQDGSAFSVALVPGGWVSVDGSRVLTLGQGAQRTQLRPNDDAASGRALGAFGMMEQVVVSSDQIFAAGLNGLVVLDRKGGAVQRRTEVAAGLSHGVLATSSDGQWLLQGGISNAVLWDLQAGRPAASIGLPDNATVRAARFLPDSRFVLLSTVSSVSSSRSWQHKLVLYDLQEGRVKASELVDGGVMDIAVDAVGKRAFVARTTGGVAIHALPDLKLAGEIPTQAQALKLSLDARSDRLLVSATGRLDVIDLGTRAPLWSVTQEQLPLGIATAEISADGRTVWLATHDDVRAYAVEGERVPLWKTSLQAGYGAILKRSPDGRRLALLAAQSAWLDPFTGAARAIEQPASAEAALWLDASHLVVLGGDGALRLWRESQPAADLELLVLNYPGIPPCGEGLCRVPPPWLVSTADGRFDAQDFAGLRELAWYRAEEPFKALPFEWLARAGYQPRLLRRTLASGLPPRQATPPVKLDPPSVRILGATPSTRDPSALRVEIEVQPRSAGLASVQLLRDGVQVARFGPDDLPAAKAGRAPFTLVVDPVRYGGWSSDALRLEAAAYDAEGVGTTAQLSYQPVFHAVRTAGAPKAALFLLSIGVNRHENASFNLGFAANDARLIGDRLSASLASGTGSHDVVRVSLVSDDATDQARKTLIREALMILSGAAPPSKDPALAGLRRAAPHDKVIISFAGHGLVDKDDEFYLLPSDTGPGTSRAITPGLLSHAMASRELASWLDGIDAGRVLLILDACHAAASVNAQDFVPGPMDSRSLGQLAYDKGIAVLVATQADDVALESGQLRHGVLSYALVADGLERRAADFAPADGYIGFVEWLSYATQRVPELSRQIRSGALAVPAGTRGARRTDAGNAPAAIAQVPSLFYFPRGRADEALLKTP